MRKWKTMSEIISSIIDDGRSKHFFVSSWSCKLTFVAIQTSSHGAFPPNILRFTLSHWHKTDKESSGNPYIFGWRKIEMVKKSVTKPEEMRFLSLTFPPSPFMPSFFYKSQMITVISWFVWLAFTHPPTSTAKNDDVLSI